MKASKCRTFVVAATTGIVILLAPGLSHAATADVPVEDSVNVEVATSSEIDSAESAEESVELRSAEQEFLEEQARSGNAVDSEEINSAEVDDATLVWEEGVDIQSLTTSEVTVDGNTLGVEMDQVVVPDPDAIEDDLTEPEAHGLGSSAIRKVKGAKPNGGLS